ncbi:hypothetical protein BaRGS_00004874 [Batillaria attramentaria]|uniref:Uncharacterized protein n=1 Tax=Batillaria attramentaria TaxID=370345 RepID=A0ABD0LX41_9CAEN
MANIVLYNLHIPTWKRIAGVGARADGRPVSRARGLAMRHCAKTEWSRYKPQSGRHCRIQCWDQDESSEANFVG